MTIICCSHMIVFTRNFALVTEGAVGCRLGTNWVTETGVEVNEGMILDKLRQLCVKFVYS